MISGDFSPQASPTLFTRMLLLLAYNLFLKDLVCKGQLLILLGLLSDIRVVLSFENLLQLEALFRHYTLHRKFRTLNPKSYALRPELSDEPR